MHDVTEVDQRNHCRSDLDHQTEVVDQEKMEVVDREEMGVADRRKMEIVDREEKEFVDYQSRHQVLKEYQNRAQIGHLLMLKGSLLEEKLHHLGKHCRLEMEHYYYKILQRYQIVQNPVEEKDLKIEVIHHQQKHFHQMDS
jgi:hypothetical protein